MFYILRGTLLSVSALMAPTRQRMEYDVQAVGRLAHVLTVIRAPKSMDVEAVVRLADV